jgi:organic hydroperoxide reductase OsmC/OhrA
MENQLTCRVTANWETGRIGAVTAEGIDPTIRFSSPPEFKGEPGFWTPEHFLVAAVASGFVVTFYALARAFENGIREASAHGRRQTREAEGRLQFTEIVLQPTLTIFQSQDRDRGYGLLERTEHEWP